MSSGARVDKTFRGLCLLGEDRWTFRKVGVNLVVDLDNLANSLTSYSGISSLLEADSPVPPFYKHKLSRPSPGGTVPHKKRGN
jgi:hypothetical protein